MLFTYGLIRCPLSLHFPLTRLLAHNVEIPSVWPPPLPHPQDGAGWRYAPARWGYSPPRCRTAAVVPPRSLTGPAWDGHGWRGGPARERGRRSTDDSGLPQPLTPVPAASVRDDSVCLSVCLSVCDLPASDISLIWFLWLMVGIVIDRCALFFRLILFHILSDNKYWNSKRKWLSTCISDVKSSRNEMFEIV